MICSAVCLVRFMVESPAQSGRLKTLIHPGPVAGLHVTGAEHALLKRQSLRGVPLVGRPASLV
jgi:hypothetical protein